MGRHGLVMWKCYFVAVGLSILLVCYSGFLTIEKSWAKSTCIIFVMACYSTMIKKNKTLNYENGELNAHPDTEVPKT